VLERLRESERRLITEATVPEECARISPGGMGWSILQTVEHVRLSDREHLSCYQDASEAKTAVDSASERRIQIFADRADARYESPENVLPTGRFACLAEALDAFRRQRQSIAAVVESGGDELHRKLVKHSITDMDGYQLFLFIAAHSNRHSLQIQEVKASTAYQTMSKQRIRG
jgi:uncharacterized damage-inducible protein DinB